MKENREQALHPVFILVPVLLFSVLTWWYVGHQGMPVTEFIKRLAFLLLILLGTVLLLFRLSLSSARQTEYKVETRADTNSVVVKGFRAGLSARDLFLLNELVSTFFEQDGMMVFISPRPRYLGRTRDPLRWTVGVPIEERVLYTLQPKLVSCCVRTHDPAILNALVWFWEHHRKHGRTLLFRCSQAELEKNLATLHSHKAIPEGAVQVAGRRLLKDTGPYAMYLKASRTSLAIQSWTDRTPETIAHQVELCVERVRQRGT